MKYCQETNSYGCGCSHIARVERDGKLYCHGHDPVRKGLKESLKSAERAVIEAAEALHFNAGPLTRQAFHSAIEGLVVAREALRKFTEETGGN